MSAAGPFIAFPPTIGLTAATLALLLGATALQFVEAQDVPPPQEAKAKLPPSPAAMVP